MNTPASMWATSLAAPVAAWAAPAFAAAAFLAGDRARSRRLRLRERLIEAREREMREIARSLIAASRESPAAVCRVLDQAVRALCPAVDVVLFSERDAGALRCTYATGERAEYFHGARFCLEYDACVLSAAALRGHRLASRGLARPLIPGDRAFIASPMVESANVIGVFYAASASVDALECEESIVTLVDLAVSAYQLAHDRRKDRERASTDALTGLLAPGAFRSALAEAIAQRAGLPGARLALLFIDTDNFKPCNDTFGHAAGDMILRTLAHIFTAEAGAEAVVARNGGDEFCILLFNAEKIEAIRKAETIRAAVETYPFETTLDGKQPTHPITTSIGVSAFPSDAKTAADLLKTADNAMYHSKEKGRNRVSFYDADALLSEL